MMCTPNHGDFAPRHSSITPMPTLQEMFIVCGPKTRSTNELEDKLSSHLLQSVMEAGKAAHFQRRETPKSPRTFSRADWREGAFVESQAALTTCALQRRPGFLTRHFLIPSVGQTLKRWWQVVTSEDPLRRCPFHLSEWLPPKRHPRARLPGVPLES